jgi:ribosomal protein S18 acetylase RimI-like enzyme
LLSIVHVLDGVDWENLESIFKKVEWKNHTKDKLIKAFSNSEFVAIGYINNRIIVCGRVLTDGTFYAAIYDVVIDPDFQGQGYGKAIVQNLLSRLEHISFVHLTATTGNEEFYRKLGLQKHKTAMARSFNPEYVTEYLE